jgi:hypothetical protein
MTHHPPLFDDITDKELGTKMPDAMELIQSINSLRDKQLHGGGLSNEEVLEGIRLLNDLRVLRAGKKASSETREPLEKLF